MKAYIEQLMDYNYWANGLIMKYAEKLTAEQFVQPVSEVQDSPQAILSHIMFAERYWLDRMEGKLVSADELHKQFGPQNYPEIKALYGAWFELELRMRQLLADFDEKDLPKSFSYIRPNGEERSYRYIDILTHVVLHGMQHRAEAAFILTHYGHSPGNLDYNYYLQP
ncbi:MAG: DinB family protein [Anaerolineales bacterium]|nr:DinB family protein [Anaerolineales bacterium]